MAPRVPSPTILPNLYGENILPRLEPQGGPPTFGVLSNTSRFASYNRGGANVVVASSPHVVKIGNKLNTLPSSACLSELKHYESLYHKPKGVPLKVKKISTTNVNISRRCRVEDCIAMARARGLCTAHGGRKKCKEENCNNIAQSRGLCRSHGGGSRCKVPQCPRSAQAKGFCRKHGGGHICKVKNCLYSVQAAGLCRYHRKRNASLAESLGMKMIGPLCQEPLCKSTALPSIKYCAVHRDEIIHTKKIMKLQKEARKNEALLKKAVEVNVPAVAKENCDNNMHRGLDLLANLIGL